MKKKSASLFVEIGLVLIVVTVLAGVAMADQKTLVVTSSEQRIDYGNRVFIYEGEVRAAWEDIVLEADRMEVHLTEENTLREIIANGNVRVLQIEKNRQVEGESATYLTEDDRLTMEGQVHYQDELGNDLQAHKMILWIRTERIEAEGSPVEAVYVLDEVKEE